jgi:histidinol phosphatase-like PHP family hydrolase
MNAVDHLSIFDTITRQEIPRGDFHLHTTWTDGTRSVKEMHDAAVAAGLRVVLFTEHARRTSGDWFPGFAAEVRSLSGERCTALVGVETKVDDLSGAIDCTDAILGHCDLVMASVHRFPGEVGNVWKVRNHAPEQALQIELSLASAVLDNPEVDILGHPFGMSYRRFGIAPPDDMMRAVIDKAARTRVAIEINPHYHPDPWRLVEWCQEAGARISLGSNAHSCENVGRITRVLEGREASAC